MIVWVLLLSVPEYANADPKITTRASSGVSRLPRQIGTQHGKARTHRPKKPVFPAVVAAAAAAAAEVQRNVQQERKHIHGIRSSAVLLLLRLLYTHTHTAYTEDREEGDHLCAVRRYIYNFCIGYLCNHPKIRD